MVIGYDKAAKALKEAALEWHYAREAKISAETRYNDAAKNLAKAEIEFHNSLASLTASTSICEEFVQPPLQVPVSSKF